MNLKNKIVVITGSKKGIGFALAHAFLQEGAEVVTSGKADTDVRKESEVKALAEGVMKDFGRIDVWVNNAGVFHSCLADDEYVDMGKAHEILDTNFLGTVFGCRTALRYMKRQEDGGVIVNVLSTAALDATRAQNAKIYAASKWAVRGYLQALKAEVPNPKILIHSVYPGGTQTDLYSKNKPVNFDEYMTPEGVAEKIVQNLKEDNPIEELVLKRPTV